MLQLADQYRLLIFILLSYSMALTFRCGLLSLAPVAFASMGSYATAILTVKAEWAILPSVVVTGLGGLVGGCLLSLPLRRIKGFYTAIATLALIIIVNSLETSLDITGGVAGLGGMPAYDGRTALIVLILCSMLGFVVLDHSMLGRRYDAAGTDPVLAASLGTPVGWYRIVAISVSSGLASLAGAFYALAFLYVSPTNFDFFFAITIVSFVVVGGVTHWIGPFVGAAVLGLIQVQVRDLVNYAEIISGVALVVVIVLEPGGLSAPLRRHLRGRRASRFWAPAEARSAASA